jgi:hypothetical protein
LFIGEENGKNNQGVLIPTSLEGTSSPFKILLFKEINE